VSRRGAPDDPVVRVCRVLPDVPAIDRVFDYGVPTSLAGRVEVGTIVRVPLHGRRVRGWVVDDALAPTDVEAPTVLPLQAVVSVGPPARVVELTAWAAWRWAGPRAVLLRTASPPNLVPVPVPVPVPAPAPAPVPTPAPEPPSTSRQRDTVGVSARAAQPGGGSHVTVVEVPPLDDDVDALVALVSERPPHSSAIVVIPPGRRARALEDRLVAAGERVVVLRADQSDAARTRAWAAARRGGCVALGGRAVAWAPVPDLGVAVVVDDGDEGLQEERVPTWHARDVLVERTARAGAALVVRSPLPPLEATALAAPDAVDRDRARAGWPLVEVVDRRDEPPGSGLVASRTVDLLRAAVDAGGRAVCVLNRRGRARLLACTACGTTTTCERCGRSVALVDPVAPTAPAAGAGSEVDAPTRVLVCAACDAQRPPLCLACGSTRLKVLRAGIAHVRDELAALVPRGTVAEVDADTDRVPQADVLVGTEAVLHRIGRAALVVVLDLDQELLAPRYRAEEQALWLLVRAGRLLGARDRDRRLVLQTRLPEHPVVEAAVRADPGRWRAVDRDRRALLQLPPSVALAEVVAEAPAMAALVIALRALDGAAVEVLGPVDGAGGRPRALLRAPAHDVLADALAATLAGARAEGRVRVEIDPLRV
jgi:primosomal protein N' (replication factor Y) (superfamily II helicase)